jgi:hypothetical protein
MARTWPYVVGGIAIAAAAAITSIFVLDDGPSRKEKAEAAMRSLAAEKERAYARAMAEEKMRAAQEAAVAAAEQAKLEAEKLKAEQDVQLARQQAIEQARTAGILGTLKATEGGAFASITGTGDFSSGLDDSGIMGGLIGNTADEAAATGFGTGGGGNPDGIGLGTIGTGRYGTLGHGSGTGQGYGVGNGRGGLRGSSASPTVRVNVSQVNGELDTDIVRRILRRNQARLAYCYEKQLLVEPALSGTITAHFEIGTDGSVTSSDASGVNDEVASCMASVIHGASFPAPKSGTVSVTSTVAVKPAPAPAP